MILAMPDSTARLDRTGAAPRQGAGAPGERLRLRTLVALRWGAVGGQLLALLITRFLLNFNLPLAACLGSIRKHQKPMVKSTTGRPSSSPSRSVRMRRWQWAASAS